MSKKSKPGDGSQAKGTKKTLYGPAESVHVSNAFGRLQALVRAARPTSR